jgi:hypothetical protein
MSDYNLSLAAFIATVLNLEVNIEILQTNKARNEQAQKQTEMLGEIIELLKGEK